MDILERHFASHDAVKTWFSSSLTDRTRIYRVVSICANQADVRHAAGFHHQTFSVHSVHRRHQRHYPNVPSFVCGRLPRPLISHLEHAVLNLRPAYRPFNVGVQHGVFSGIRRSSSVSGQPSNCNVFRPLESASTSMVSTSTYNKSV